MYVNFPWHFDSSGGTATTTRSDHVRDMLVQFLFTNPGERVNRPEFGAGLYRMCFEGNSDQLGDVLHFLVQAGLQRWFGEDIEVLDLQVLTDEAVLTVKLDYRLGNEVGQRKITITPKGVA
jgi:hypothetical protein